MGVMHCDRDGCENILCDRRSYEFGDICDECFAELSGLGVTTREQVAAFMNTTSRDNTRKAQSQEFLELEFPTYENRRLNSY